MDTNIFRLAERVRRRTRDVEVIELCDLILAASVRPADEQGGCSQEASIPKAKGRASDGNFNKAAYQRDYMRRKREAARAGKGDAS